MMHETESKSQRFAAILADLNRCPHGRHERDICNGCGGPSKGNPYLSEGAHIGYDISGYSIVVPSWEDWYDPAAWIKR